MSRILIRGGRIVDPKSGSGKTGDILIEGGRIVERFSKTDNIETIEAKGYLVTPGLIDIHVHLREPGREDEETVVSGSRAAAAGGFTAIACMPNTDPPIDKAAIVTDVLEKSKSFPVEVKVVASITKGRAGAELAEMGELISAGAVAFSDDGSSVADSALMRSAFEYAKIFNTPIISHAEDGSLAKDGVMHEGFFSTVLGLKGIPAAAEEVMAARDIILAELTGARLHIAHISTRGTVELVRKAKKAGLNVTCEATPHHLALSDKLLNDYDTNYKVNPPLRSADHIDALWDGLMDGTIDVIATDHAPHASHEKEAEIERAPFGMIGLETAVQVLITEAEKRGIKFEYLVPKMTLNPAKVIGLNAGDLSYGDHADLTIIDTKAKVKVDSNNFESKSANTPFDGLSLTGQVVQVYKKGRRIVEDGRVTI